MWLDQRFMNINLTTEQARMCYPGIVRKEQIDMLWKPDLRFDGIIDGVRLDDTWVLSL